MATDGLPELTWSVGPAHPSTPSILELGDVHIHGRMPWSSNGTFLVSVTHEGLVLPGIYKPESGERPLWDFPSGLWKREVAASELNKLLSWQVIPPTVIHHGPLGVGSMQYFVDADYSEHYFTFGEDPAHRTQLRELCLLDLIANNTDRKGGHILASLNQIWGIDNGLSFHEETKIRTVLWEFAGEPLTSAEHESLSALAESDLESELGELLTNAEIEAMRRRLDSVRIAGTFPVDRSGHGYPWPLV